MLKKPLLGHKLHTPECESTNNLLNDLLNNRDPATLKHGLFITTDYQTGGRGYGNNTWYSSRGKNLLMSILLTNPSVPPEMQFNISRIISLALSYCLKNLLPAPSEIQIKWPNDLMCNGKKIAGILIEHKISGDKILHSIAGIGLNVNEERFPPDIQNATSLLIETGQLFSTGEILERFQRSLVTLNQQVKPSAETLHRLYDSDLHLLGEQHRFSDQNGHFYGTITGTRGDGLLRLKTAAEERFYGFKEVSFETD